MCLLRHIIPFSFAGRRAVCGEPGDGTVLAAYSLTERHDPSVYDVGNPAHAGEVRRRHVGKASVRRRRVEQMSLLLQPLAFDERQRFVHRSLTKQQRECDRINVHVHFYAGKQ